jgi:uncharacterized membrane protein YeaQ/YmgE (transglycosylase-associated protein family)
MSMIVWILLGLGLGLLASKLVSTTGEGTVVDILLVIVGGVVGGWLFNLFGGTGMTGFDIDSVYSAGAAVMLFAILPANLAAQEHDGRRLSSHGGLENRLGRHYSRFSAFWRVALLTAQRLARRNPGTAGRIGEVRLSLRCKLGVLCVVGRDLLDMPALTLRLLPRRRELGQRQVRQVNP